MRLVVLFDAWQCPTLAWGDPTLPSALRPARNGHFFKPQMLVTQFAALEQPGADENDVMAIDINQPLDAVIADTVRHIQSFLPQDVCA